VRVVEMEIQTDSEYDSETKSVVFEGWYQEDYAILHKGAGYVAHVA
jgi:hypothetical protein